MNNIKEKVNNQTQVVKESFTHFYKSDMEEIDRLIKAGK